MVTVIVAVFGADETTVTDGAPGIVFGISATEAVEVSDTNRAFSAITVKVYAVPFVKPVMLQVNGFGKGALSTQDPPAGDEVIVYLVGADSAAFATAANETLADPFAGTAITLVGASGLAKGFTALDVADEIVVSVAFVEVVVNV